MSAHPTYWFCAKLFCVAIFAFGVSGCSFDASLSSTTETLPSIVPTTPTPKPYLRGINMMDLGMSGGVYPGVFGTNYTKPTLTGLQNLRSRGHQVIRLPFLWERVQPTLGGALNPTYMGYIIDSLKDANTAGLKVILDMHNYGAYTSGGVQTRFGEDDGPTTAEYQDAWTKIAAAIQAEPDAAAAVYAYDIMNEPVGLPDTRGMVVAADAEVIASFASTTESWSAGSQTVAHDTSIFPAGALKISASLPAASYQIFGASRTITLDPANGSTIQIKGYLPATTQGTYPRIRLWLLEGYTQKEIGVAVIDSGDFNVRFVPTAAQWSGMTSMRIELILNSVDGNGPYEFYLDEVWQGDPIVGKSPAKVWEEYSQSVVDALRTAGDKTLIMVEGYSFAAAHRWKDHHPTAWINDPLDKIIYQAHTYMDSDSSGTYVQDFTTETADAIGSGYASVADRAVARIKIFTDWTKEQNVKGFIGEFGWPNSAISVDWASWDEVGEAVMDHIESVEMGCTLWATGSWLDEDDNILNAYSMKAPFTPLSPAAVYERYLQP